MARLSGLVTKADWHAWTTDDLRRAADIAFTALGPQRRLLGSDWPGDEPGSRNDRSTLDHQEVLQASRDAASRMGEPLARLLRAL
ncbi:hypothetical protein SAMN05414137_114216 [Streptacidiphilus jiangxiensis]|uniref:Amidohydrolase-related domain-containing protein n=1 Tax=Streptacidiphilus jiangxiensis TaxID=235985 RepID=A0A1H7TUB9_STRJI|nr:hypothetical protein SAMN05414137_114216 [Streptacidiphilus jiangxiensis]